MCHVKCMYFDFSLNHWQQTDSSLEALKVCVQCYSGPSKAFATKLSKHVLGLMHSKNEHTADVCDVLQMSILILNFHDYFFE